jgi:hypothetical protein
MSYGGLMIANRSRNGLRRLLWASLTIWLTTTASAVAEEVWFAPPDNLVRFDHQANEDFPQLFGADAKWAHASSRINVFNLTAFYILRAPEAELRAAVNLLAAHHIALNVDLLALPAENCGRGVEGILPNVKETTAAAVRLKQLNASVYSFAFDEPLEYGHIYKGRAACNFTVSEVAKRVALTVREVRLLYPNAKFVDYEVPQDLPLNDWRTTLNEWLTNYEDATGIPLDGFAIDAHFREPWREWARSTIDILHARGLRAGIFLTASGGPDVTDQSWMKEAKENILNVGAAKLPLDFAIIATWVNHPYRNLPETDPLALTSLVNWYFEHRAVSR